MKNRILFIAFLAFPIFLFAQSPSDGQNYVKTSVYKVETQTENVPADEKIESVTYHDGLGRPMQEVSYKAGGGGQDIITPMVYDALGRQEKEYLPYADPQQSGASMSYRDNETVLLPSLESHYLNKHPNELDPNDPNPYSKKVFEASPLNRVLEQGAPGESWKVDPLGGTGHTVKYSYQTNQNGEVRRFGVSHPGGDTERTKLEYEGYYHASQLYKRVTKDENWQPGQQHEKDHTTEEFTDKQGRVVLKRTYDKNQRHDTYYAYDDYGNLTYVIPPLASAQIIKGGFVAEGISFNYPWTKLAQVDAEFAEEYEHRLLDYENEDILNADLENEYGGQGGFSVSTTEGSEDISLSIVFSANQPLPLKTGRLVSLEAFGEFPNTELGRIEGQGYQYLFYISDNAIMVEGEGEVSAINKNFGNTTLAYSKNYPWTAYTEVNPDFARQYEEQLEAYPNAQWLTVNIPNQHNGHGGLNISIDEQDKVTVSFIHGSTTPFPLKEGLAIPLETERRIEDGELGTISGPGYEYTFSIEENSLKIEGGGTVASLNGVLTKVKQPSPYVSVPVVEGLCYIYHYDHRNRVVEKKIPGKGWQYIVYNKLDQPVFTQDANLRLEDDWLFTKYDALGRVAYTGRYRFAPQGTADNAGRLELQAEMDGQTTLWEARTTSQNSISGTALYYTNNVYPSINGNATDIQLHTVHYYDTYAPDITAELPAPTGNIYGETPTTKTKGLPTGSKIRILGTGDWILSTTYYDEKGRAIYTASHNEHLQTLDVGETDLDFTGKVLATKSTHTYGTKAPIIVEDDYTYDHMQRLLTQVQTINGGTPELIVNNTYDELGKLKSKKVGGATAPNPENSTGLQTIDYEYNIRGWLREINDPYNMAGNDLFGFKLYYDHGNAPLYNGNISEVHWETVNDNQLRKYKYSYDALNRITNAEFSGGYTMGVSPTPEDYGLDNISYDKNGNILSLKRSGATVLFNGNATNMDIIDDLSYFYAPQSNTLMKVNDVAYDQGFKNGNNTGNDYAHDLNGNLLKDLNKDIVNIGYNHLNLPTQINKHGLESGDWIGFEYDALGIKMKKTLSDNYNISETEYAGNYIYEDGQLRMSFHPEGYVEPVDPGDYSQGFRYVYQYSDIWGNVRLSYKNIGTASSPDLQIQDEKNYYPFGMEHQGYNGNLIGNENNYQTYQNKELEEELGLNWHDFGARRFQSDIARWTTLDPLAEKFYSWSPYNVMNNNPVMFVDPTGMASESTDIEFETSDVDVMVNIGYGRKMASSQFGGAMNFSGGTPEINNDIRFRDESGNLIATYYTDKFNEDVYLPVSAPETNINLNKQLEKVDLEDIDIIGIGGSWDFTFVMGGGVSMEAIYFLDGKNKGSFELFKTKRQNVGGNGSVGVYGIFANFHGTDSQLTSSDYTGRSFSASMGLRSLWIGGYSKFWAPINYENDKFGYKSYFNKQQRLWSGYTIGGGVGAGVQLSKQSTSVYE